MNLNKIKLGVFYKYIIISENANTIAYFTGEEILGGYMNMVRNRITSKVDNVIFIFMGSTDYDKRKKRYITLWKNPVKKKKDDEVKIKTRSRINFEFIPLYEETSRPTLIVKVPKNHKGYELIKAYGLDTIIKLED